MKFAKVYTAWLLATFFYCYQYALRVFPASVESEIRCEFHLTAQEFGTIGSLAIYAYAFMQIPIGILIDRVGLKKILIASNILCVFGTFLMSNAQNANTLQISRILIGIGSASAFMLALKIAADYLPRGLRGLFMGATLTFGTIGAMFAGNFFVSLLVKTDWRFILLLLGWIGVAFTLFNIISFNVKPVKNCKKNGNFNFNELVKILTNRSIVIYAILAIGVYTPLSVLTDLWGPVFLMKKYQIVLQEATFSITFLFIGLSIGSLLLPVICEKWNCLNFGIQVCSFILLILFSFLLFNPISSIYLLKTILFLIGICCGAEMMCFSGSVRAVQASNSGLAIGVVNTLNMLGGASFQQIIGYLLDLQWNGALNEHGIRIYSNGQFVLSLSPLLFIIALCCFLSIRLSKIMPDYK